MFAWAQDEEEGAMMAASDECWEKGIENWTKVTPQKYQAKKKLEYDATCSYIYSAGLYRTYFNLTDGNILIIDQVYRNNTYSSDPDDVVDVCHLYMADLNEWFEVDINTFETECLSCDLNYIAAEVTKLAGKTIGRYVLPIEDVYILLEGKDFDGVQANRAVAGGFILIEFIPGGKILKPVTKGLKAGTKATVKGTRKIYKLVKGTKVVVGEFADDVLKPVKWIDGEVDEVVEVLQDVTYANVDGKEVKGVLQVVKKGDDIGFRLAKFTTKEVDEFAKAATKNPDSKKIILGKYVENSPLSYDVIAKEGNYTYFNLDNWNEAFEMVGKNRDEMWRVNEKFLDDQIDKGKEIFFSHDPWKANGYFEKEVLYLIDKGAKDFVKLENGLWKAIW